MTRKTLGGIDENGDYFDRDGTLHNLHAETLSARDKLLFSIAVSLRRLADDTEQIKNGYRFICERWGQR